MCRWTHTDAPLHRMVGPGDRAVGDGDCLEQLLCSPGVKEWEVCLGQKETAPSEGLAWRGVQAECTGKIQGEQGIWGGSQEPHAALRVFKVMHGNSEFSRKWAPKG